MTAIHQDDVPEPAGDFNVATIARLKEENGRLTEVLGHLLRCEYDGHGLTDCTDNDGVRYQSADLAKQIETAEALLSALALSTGDAG